MTGVSQTGHGRDQTDALYSQGFDLYRIVDYLGTKRRVRGQRR